MEIIVDADVIIRGEKGIFDLGAWVASRAGDQFEIAAITVAELWHGVERAARARKTRRRQYIETVIGGLPIISNTEQTAYEHARLWAELESAGRLIGDYDLIVAATALERGSAVATVPSVELSP
jgi:predicted nucleic acid-binding protein